MARQDRLGAYGDRFGIPELEVKIENGKIVAIEVLRGAPCGASWDASLEILGVPAEEAQRRFGLEVQYLCTADPAKWDPLWGKSPLHYAADIHRAALINSIKRAGRP